MLIRVTSVDYVPEEPDDDYGVEDLTVRVVGRSGEGERVTRYITGARPDLYVPTDEPIPDGDWEVLGVETGYEGIDAEAGEKVPAKRITVAHPKQVRRLREQFSQTFEADIPFYRRVTYDHDLSGYIRFPDGVTRAAIGDVETAIDPDDVDPIDPRVVIGDIEVVGDDDVGFDEMKVNADAEIIAVTFYDTYREDYDIYVVDPEHDIVATEVREQLYEHWGDHEDAEDFAGAPIGLHRVDTETDLLKCVIGYIQDRRPDITAGWNWVDFDWYYLLTRMYQDDAVDVHKMSDLGHVQRRKIQADRRGVESAVQGLPAFDQMEGLHKQTYGEWRSKALEFVASDQLGVGKIPNISVPDAYRHDRTRLAAYNLLDVQLTVGLTEMHGIEEFFLGLADLCSIQIVDTWSEKREVDGYIASRRDDDEVLPTQTERDIEEPAGGLVLTPGDGVYDDVAVLDLKSLYPSSMLTMNISPETMAEPSEADVVIPGMPEKEADVGGTIDQSDINWTDDDPELPWSMRPKGFTFDEQGVIPKYVGGMFPQREHFKIVRDEYEPGDDEYVVYDNQQRGIKVVMNSFFGVTNSGYFRLAKDGIGDAITGISRYVLWRAAEYVESLGYEVIYGDTDSVIISLDHYDEDRTTAELVKDASGLVNQLNRHMSTVAEDLGLPDDHPFLDMDELPHDLPADASHAWYFEFEKLYDRFIQVGSKKRYAGTLQWKEGKEVDDLDVTGFEATRTDQMEITAEMQRQVIRGVLDGWGFNKTSRVVRQELERFDESAEDLHEIGVPWNLNKPLEGPDSYGNLPNARAARYSNEHLDKNYSAGDDFRGYYVKKTPSFQAETDVIALDWTDDIPEGYELDRTKTIEKAFESALTPILEEVGWTFNEILQGKQNQAAADDDVMEYDGDPFASAGGDESDDDEPDEDGPSDDEYEGAAAW